MRVSIAKQSVFLVALAAQFAAPSFLGMNGIRDHVCRIVRLLYLAYLVAWATKAGPELSASIAVKLKPFAHDNLQLKVVHSSLRLFLFTPASLRFGIKSRGAR